MNMRPSKLLKDSVKKCRKRKSDDLEDNEYQEDQADNNENVAYSCDQCNYNATEIQTIKNHKESCHKVYYSCDLCDHTSTHSQNLKTHIEAEHQKNI